MSLRSILAIFGTSLLATALAAQAPLDVTGIQVNETAAAGSPPAVVVGPDGGFFVVWEGPSGLYARAFGAGGTPLGEELHLASTPPHRAEPAAARLADGGFVVVWNQGTVRARRFDGAGEPAGKTIEVAVDDGVQLAVAAFADGGFAVVWVVFETPGTGARRHHVFWRRFDAAGQPVGAAVRVTGRSSIVTPYPAIAAGDGPTIVWAGEDDDGTARVLARRYDAAGQPAGDRILVSATDGTAVPTEIDVASDPAGGLLVVWTRLTVDDSRVMARRLAASGGLGDELRVDTASDGEAFGAAVAADAEGDFLVVWTHRLREVSRYQARLLTDGAKALEPAGDAFTLTVDPAVVQTRPRAAADAHDFLVTYARADDAGVAFDVFARRLPAALRPGLLRLAVERVEAVESEREVRLSVLRVGGVAGDVSVDYRTADGTAVAGEDYSFTAGTLDFADGDATPRVIRVPLTADSDLEDDEALTLTLTNPGGGALVVAPAATEIALVEDDYSTPGDRPPPTSSELRVDSPGGGSITDPRFVRGGDGDLLIVWLRRHDLASADVYARRFDAAGLPRGPARRLSDDTAADRGTLAVARDGAGGFLVVWGETLPGFEWVLLGRRMNAAGQPRGDVFRIFGCRETGCGGIADPGLVWVGGSWVVIWGEDFIIAPPRSFVRGRVVDAVTGALGELFTVDGIERAARVTPAGDGGEGFMVVGQTPPRGLLGQRYDARARPVGPLLELADADTPARLAIARDGTGEYLLVWHELDPATGHDVWARRLAGDGTPVGPRFRVNSFTFGDQTNPNVVAAAGGFVVVWQSARQDGDGLGVFGQRIAADGGRQGGEFLINAETLGDQQAPAVVPVDDGFAVVWENRLSSRWRTFQSFGCRADAFTLCLRNGRFAVTARWRDFAGAEGRGRAHRLTSDTGAFWFFGRDNLELMAKVLDGRSINGHHWVFYGSLSNVEFTLEVTDTVTGAVRQYFNPSGRFASAGDVEAF